MITDTQILANNFTATGARLRCILGINQYHTPTSFCRFVRGELHELTPGHISYAPVDDMVPVGLHIRNIQILKGDELVFVHQFAAFLVREILEAVGLPLISMLQGVNRLLSFGAALRKSLLLALQSGDVFRVPFHPPLALDLLTIRKNGKSGQAQVNPYHLIRGRERMVGNLAGKAGVPITHCIPPNRQSFDFPFNGAVLDDLQCADFGKEQAIIQEIEPGLLEGETIVAPKPLEARITGFFASFDPPEEGFECQINALLNVLQYLDVY